MVTKVGGITLLTFSTGRKELAFNAIDGLGMLEKIPFFIADNTTLVDIFTAIFYIKTALLKLEYPSIS